MPRLVTAIAAALIAIVSGAAASAQTFPQRTVKFILPFGPASGTDITARLVGERLSERWGKPVVIENRPGGDGLVAINAFVSANDDHTLLWVPVGTFAVHPYDKDKLPYDADRDLIPIANVSTLYLALSAPASLASTRSANSSIWRRQSRQVQLRRRQRQRRLPDHRIPQEQQPGRGQGALSRHHAGAERSRRGPHPAVVVVACDRHAAVSGRQDQDPGGDRPQSARRACRTCRRCARPAIRRWRWRASAACSGRSGMPLATREKIAADVRAAVASDPSIATKLQSTGQVVDVRGPQRVRGRHQGAAGPARRHRQGARHEGGDGAVAPARGGLAAGASGMRYNAVRTRIRE